MIDTAEYLPVPVVDAELSPPPPESKLLGELKRREVNDPNELLRTGYLCRGGGALLVGPTGIGKSSLSMQFAIGWAVGMEVFEIDPVNSLKSLIIQAENDDGDIAEMRDGVIKGLNLTPTQAAKALGNIVVATEDIRTAKTFCDLTVAPLLEQHRPDLLWIDPALAYLGGDSGSQKDVGGFLRNLLNPLLHRFACAGIVTSHTNKPPWGREKPTWTSGDFAYLGTGSAEWANWARAVLALRSIGSHDVFELRAGKRGGRLGWTNEDGTKSFVRHIAHAKEPGAICWHTADSSEFDQGGRPKDYDENELLELLPNGGMTSTEWRDEAAKECGIKERSFYKLIKSLEKKGQVLKSKLNKKWQPIQK